MESEFSLREHVQKLPIVLTINVPDAYTARYVMILMQANLFRGP